MREECLLHLERAADVFITSQRREARRFEKAVLAVSMAVPVIRQEEDPDGYGRIPNLEALLRFKAVLTDLHHRIVKGEVEPDRRLTEIIMAMGYDHLANYFLGYYQQELYQQLPPATINVYTSIRRKVGVFVREARGRLQASLASGAYKITYCRNCSSQAFIFPKVIQRDNQTIPDLSGECYLCTFKGKVRICRDCGNPFHPPSAIPVRDGGQPSCNACLARGSAGQGARGNGI